MADVTIKVEETLLRTTTDNVGASVFNTIAATIRHFYNGLWTGIQWIKSGKTATKELEIMRISHECNLSHPCDFGY